MGPDRFDPYCLKEVEAYFANAAISPTDNGASLFTIV